MIYLKQKTKYLLSLITVLIIGFVIGFLTNGRITMLKIHRMQSFFTERGFDRTLIRVIKPLPEQMENIKPILQKYARKNRQRIWQMHEGQRASFDSLKREIAPFLYKQQLKRLERFRNHRINGFFNKPPRRRFK